MLLKISISYLLVYLIWGTSMLATRYMVADSHLIWGFALRYLGAALLLGFGFILHPALRNQWRPTMREGLHACGTGILLLVLAVLLRAYSLTSITSGELGILSAMTPMFIALFAWQLGGCRPGKHHIVGGLLGMLGTAIIGLNQAHGSSTMSGLLLAIAGIIFWALGIVLQKTLAQPESTLSRVFLQNVAAGGVLAVIGMTQPDSPLMMIATWKYETLCAFLHLTILGSTISTVAYMFLLKNEPLFRVATTSFVIPVIAVLAGGLFGERVDAIVIAALLLSLAGTVIAMWGPALKVLILPRSGSLGVTH